jgi:hypothetical protein
MIADLMVSAMKKSAPNFDTLVQTVGKGFSYKPPVDGNPLTWPAVYNQSGQCNTIVKINSGKYDIATPFNCNGKRVQVGG